MEALTVFFFFFFLPLFASPVFHDENKTREKKKKKKRAILSFLLSVYSLEAGPYEPRKRPKAGGQCPPSAFKSRHRISGECIIAILIVIDRVDRVRKSISSNFQKGIFSVRDGLFLSMVRLWVFHGWFLNALCFAAARPTNVPVHKEYAWQ